MPSRPSRRMQNRLAEMKVQIGLGCIDCEGRHAGNRVCRLPAIAGAPVRTWSPPACRKARSNRSARAADARRPAPARAAVGLRCSRHHQRIAVGVAHADAVAAGQAALSDSHHSGSGKIGSGCAQQDRWRGHKAQPLRIELRCPRHHGQRPQSPDSQCCRR